jgi:hypothetical protein
LFPRRSGAERLLSSNPILHQGFRPLNTGGEQLSDGDLIGGDLRHIEAGCVKINSVLLGLRRYELNRKVAAVLLRDVPPSPAPLEVATHDGSLWRPERLAFEQDTLVLSTPLLGEWRIPADELLEIRRNLGSAQR